MRSAPVGCWHIAVDEAQVVSGGRRRANIVRMAGIGPVFAHRSVESSCQALPSIAAMNPRGIIWASAGKGKKH